MEITYTVLKEDTEVVGTEQRQRVRIAASVPFMLDAYYGPDGEYRGSSVYAPGEGEDSTTALTAATPSLARLFLPTAYDSLVRDGTGVVSLDGEDASMVISDDTQEDIRGLLRRIVAGQGA